MGTWYAEGNEVNALEFGSTGTIQANGNIAWHRTATKPSTKETPESSTGHQSIRNDSGKIAQVVHGNISKAARWSC